MAAAAAFAPRRHNAMLPCWRHPAVVTSTDRVPTRHRELSSVADELPYGFEEVEELGVGGHGCVTKIRHRVSSHLYALKIAHADDSSAVTEAEVLHRTCNRHVVRYYAALRSSSGELGIFIEFMDAGSLDRVLRCHRSRGIFPESAVAEVAAQCLAGLAYLHSRGIAYLDIKPGNLLANTRGDVKLGYFGIAKILPHSRDHCSIARGTLASMSPERYHRKARASRRGAFAADVWGLGVTILELFLGRLPIRHPGRGAIGPTEPPSVSDGTAASEAFRGFVHACLQKEPKKHATVTELLEHPFVTGRDAGEALRALRETIADSM